MNRAKPPLGGDYWRFFTAASLSNIGDGIRVAAFPLLAASVTDSPTAVGAVAAAQALPWQATGLLAGALADRWVTRRLVAGADIARVLVLAALIAAITAGIADVAVIVACAFALGVGETIRDTAAQTAVPRLVAPEALERANGRLVAGEIVGNEFIGPPIGSALFVVGAALPFAANGATMALAVMLVLSLPLTVMGRPVPEKHTEPDTSVRAGIGWLARHRVLRALVFVGAAVATADAAWFAILVLYTRQTLDLGAVGFGVLLATGAVGGVLGSFLADRVIRGHRHRGAMAVSMAVTAGLPVLLVIAPRLWAAVFVIVATSAAFAVFNVAGLSLRQRLVPQGLLGRVTATSRTVLHGSAALGALLGGALASVSGMDAPFLFSGAMAVVATTAWLLASRPGGRQLASGT
ncbi:MAG: MFS transporter [Stackebrandtia sp.]